MLAIGALAPILVALLLSCATGRTGPPPVPELEEGFRLRAELAPGEVREFALAAPQEMFIHLFVDAEASDLAMSIIGEAGSEILRAQFAPYGEIRQVLVSTLPARVNYRVRLRGGSQATPFRLVIQDLHPASPLDQARVPGLQSLYMARSLFAIGLSRNHYQTALDLLRRAEDDLAGVDPAYRAYSVLQQANAWLYLQEGEKTLAAAHKARRLFEALQGGENAARRDATPYRHWLAEAYGTEAAALRDLGRLDEALPLLDRAVNIHLGLGDRGTVGAATNLNNRGLAHAQLNQFELAEADFLGALRIVAETTRLQSRKITYLVNLADLHRQQGRLRESLSRFREAEALARVLPGAHEPSRLHLEATLGRFYVATGDYDEAGRLLTNALKLARQQENRRFERGVLRSLGLLQRIIGDLAAAEESYRTALVVAQEQDSLEITAGTLLDLGTVLVERGDPRGAQPLIDEALDAARRGGMHTLQSRALILAARLAAERGDTDEALTRSLEAMAIARESSPRLLFGALLRHGQTLLASGELDAADTVLREALSKVPENGFPVQRMQVQVSLGRVARESGDLDAARYEILRAVEILEDVRANLSSPSAKTGFLAHHHDLYGLLIEVLVELHEREPTAGWAAQALELSERSRARTLAEMISGERPVQLDSVDPSLGEQERLEKDVLSLLYDHLNDEIWENSTKREEQAARLQTLQRELRDTRQANSSTEQTIRNRHPEYARIRYPEPVNSTSVARLLPPGTALLHFVLLERGSFLFVVRGGSVELCRLPPEPAIRTAVEDLREALRHSDIRSTLRLRRASREIHRQVLAPALPLLLEAKRLYVVPDGALHLVPLELLEDDQGQHAVERWEIAYVPSASVLTSLENRSVENWSMDFVGFADPAAFPKGDDRQEAQADRQVRFLPFEALPGTSEEVNAIAALFPDRSTLYLGPAANEDNLFENSSVGQARWVHFASHGVLVEDRPLESAILLSPDAEGDRLLEVAEIFNLKLTSELVVLSACETGLGKVVRGEGMVGMSRAFFFAGTRNMLVSLWPVQDRSTGRFMIDLYSGLSRGETATASLRRAKLRWIKDGLPVRAWAPFILLGPFQYQRSPLAENPAANREWESISNL